MKVSVIGSGIYATALSKVISSSNNVKMWCYEQGHYEEINCVQENNRYAPGYKLENITAYDSIPETLKDTKISFYVSPALFGQAILEQCIPHLNDGHIWVIAAKGVNADGTTLYASALQACKQLGIKIVVISGPSFASCLLDQKMTNLNIAGNCQDSIEQVKQLLTRDYLRVNAVSTPNFVSICGYYKNVLAIGSGLLSGMQVGDNIVASFITQGIQELLEIFPEEKDNFYNYFGIGDVILTCYGQQSRNRQYGESIALGKDLDHITAEGKKNILPFIKHIEQKHKGSLKIASLVYQMIHKEINREEFIQRIS